MDQNCKRSLFDIIDETGKMPWPPRTIFDENIIRVRLGPTGGRQGYTATTGNPAGEIAFYLNDLLIPELTVERGQTYTFIVETGDNKILKDKYHPFYITDSPEGGYGVAEGEKPNYQNLYAGVEYDVQQYVEPTAGNLLFDSILNLSLSYIYF